MTIETLLKSYTGISIDTIAIYLKDKTINISNGKAKIYDNEFNLIDIMDAISVPSKVRGKRLGTFTVSNNELLVFEKGVE